MTFYFSSSSAFAEAYQCPNRLVAFANSLASYPLKFTAARTLFKLAPIALMIWVKSVDHYQIMNECLTLVKSI